MEWGRDYRASFGWRQPSDSLGQDIRVVGKGNLQAYVEDSNLDGLNDLVVQIEDTDGTYSTGDTIAELNGVTYDGTNIYGTDSICIVPK